MLKAKNCPSCNLAFVEVKPNAILLSIIKTFLKENPEHTRDETELKALEGKNTIKDGITVKQDKPKPKPEEVKRPPEEVKRPQRAPPVNPAYDPAIPPAPRFALPNGLFPRQFNPQPINPRPFDPFNPPFGYYVNPNPIFGGMRPASTCVDCNRLGWQGCGRFYPHVRCFSCNNEMPERPGSSVRCMVCQNSFCNMVVLGSRCQTAGLNPLGHYNTTVFNTIPADALNSNAFERKVFEDYLKQKRLTLEYVYNTLFQGQTLVINHNELNFRRDSVVCLACAQQIWRELIVIFRIGIEASLSQIVRQRPRCEDGIRCRQMGDRRHAEEFRHYYF
mmetsp:Transcript_26661/g.47988  ORF Transcript_26661/g.47988 Transcript_26661/m.47988 type:complete len:333 (+) Transcript_26661:585-1583(+)